MLPIVQLGNARTGLLQLRVQAAAYGAQNDAQRAKAKTDHAQWLQLVDDNIKAYEATFLDEEVQGLKAWHLAYPAYLASRAVTLSLFDAGRDDEAKANRDGDASQKVAPASTVLDGLIGIQARVGAEMNQ